MPAYRAKPPKGAMLNRADPLASGLVGAWLFDEVGGTTAYDSVAAFPGTYNGEPPRTVGPYGRQVLLNGTDDFVDIPLTSSKVSSSFSAVILLNSTFAAGSGGENRYCLAYGGASENFGIAWTHTLTAYNGACFMAGSGSYPVVTWGTKPAANAWALIAMTWDGATIKAYVNGALQGSTSNSTFASVTTPNLWVGKNAASKFLVESVAGVWIYNRAISQTAVNSFASDPFRMFRRRYVPVPLSIPATSTFTGSGSLSTDAATTSGSGTHTAPTYTGSGSLSAEAATTSGSGTHTAPVYTGSATLATESATMAGVGFIGTPAYTGSGGLNTEAATCAGSGAFIAPAYTGSGNVSTESATIDGAGAFVSTICTGSGALAATAATCAGVGTRAAPATSNLGKIVPVIDRGRIVPIVDRGRIVVVQER